MSAITMKNIVKKYGDGFPAVNDVSIDIADGEFMILVGPSGCGKSTLLRMIVGLEDISSGDMLIGDRRVFDHRVRLGLPGPDRAAGAGGCRQRQDAQNQQQAQTDAQVCHGEVPVALTASTGRSCGA